MKMFKSRIRLLWLITNLVIFGGYGEDETYDSTLQLNLTTCNYFCYTVNVSTEQYFPPAFSDPCSPPNIQSDYVAAKGEMGVYIVWAEPVVTDPNGDIPRIEQASGKTNGSYFNGSADGQTYNIVYIAEDKDGLKDSCHFEFDVYVERHCTTPVIVENGYYNCTNGSMPGSTCKYQCREGHTMIGNSDVICDPNNNSSYVWSTAPSCEVVHCVVPTKPNNGNITCNDSKHSYLSICSITCQSGFTAEGPLYMICQANASWSRTTKCTYFEPLAVHCISPQIFHTSPMQTAVAVTWQRPTSLGIENNMTEVHQVDGPEQGDTLDSGLHMVTYKISTNESNESAECNVELQIQVVTCDHPAYSFNDSLLIFGCSSPSLLQGTVCQVSCSKNFQLVGNLSINCVDNGQKEGIWDSGVDEEPFCNETSCPPYLENPSNGTLVYRNNETGSEVEVVCYEGFGFQYKFSGRSMCTDAEWDQYQLPDCVSKAVPEYLLEASIHFYGHGCAENVSQIYKDYQLELEIQYEKQMLTLCPENEICKVENVSIECNSLTNIESTTNNLVRLAHVQSLPRSSTTHELVTKLTINIETNGNRSQDTFEHYKDMINQVWNNSRSWVVSTVVAKLQEIQDFRVEYWDISTNATPTCIADYIIFELQCKTCAKGFYLNQTLDKCQECPHGTYKEKVGVSPCIICPEGTWTKKKGSLSIDECKEYCKSGSVSPDGLESCAVCPKGFYQDTDGQNSCKPCPSGTTTVLPNCTRTDECKVIHYNNTCTTTSCNGHRCLNKEGNISCVCSDGWSGDDCEYPPDNCAINLCGHGSTCVNANNSYTCSCQENYLGVLCENSPENGRWTEWSIWSKCSVTCGQGTRQRKRLCRNPIPTNNGERCFGPAAEHKICDQSECLSCSNLTDTNSSYPHCAIDPKSGSQICTISCKEGFILGPWSDGIRNLSCGMQTGLIWTPVNTTSHCSEIIIPHRLMLESSIEYNELIPVQYYDMVKNYILGNVLTTDCFKANNCRVNVDIDIISSKRSILKLFFEKNITLGENENSTKESTDFSLTVLEASIEDMENTARYLEDFTSEIFDFDDTTNGTIKRNGPAYTVIEDTLQIHGEVICDDGQAVVYGMCVVCPPGTYSIGGSCHFCIKGTYQPNTGQITCRFCPPGLTTETIGAYNVTQCGITVTTITVVTDDEDSLLTVVETYVTIAASIVGTIATFITAYCCKNGCDKHKKGGVDLNKSCDNFSTLEKGGGDLNKSCDNFSTREKGGGDLNKSCDNFSTRGDDSADNARISDGRIKCVSYNLYNADEYGKYTNEKF